MLHYQIDPGTAVPAYRQLVQQVQYYVASGTVKVDEKLPSIRAMARYLGVNPSTIVKAYGELESAGTIERRHGSGAFVRAIAGSMTTIQQQSALRERAKRLAVEAKQMGADQDLVLRIVTEELANLELPSEPQEKPND